MDFRHLRTYLEVLRQDSFSGAARALGLSQPAVSQQIKVLEKEVGTALLVRSAQGVLSLTAAGEAFQRYAESTLSAHEAMHQQIARLQDAIEGPLNLAASTIPGDYVLPRLLMAFKKRYPDVDAQLTVADTRDVVRKLMERECAVGFIGAPLESPRLALEPWGKDEIVLAVYPHHSFATQSTISLKELEDQALILREKGSGTRQSVERLLREQGKSPSWRNVVLTLGSTQGVVRAVRDGLGVGFISAHAAASEKLPIVRIRGLDLTRELYMTYEPGRVTSGLLRAFLAFARAWIADRHT